MVDFTVCRELWWFNLNTTVKPPKSLARDGRGHDLQLPKNCDIFMGKQEELSVVWLRGTFSPSFFFFFLIKPLSKSKLNQFALKANTGANFQSS